MFRERLTLLPLQGERLTDNNIIPRVPLRSALGYALIALAGRTPSGALTFCRIMWGYALIALAGRTPAIYPKERHQILKLSARFARHFLNLREIRCHVSPRFSNFPARLRA